MATPIRPYIVTEVATGKRRLIQAYSQAAARAWVARQQYEVCAATGMQVLELIRQGVQPELAGAEEIEGQQALVLEDSAA